jgi:hypothetical protein
MPVLLRRAFCDGVEVEGAAPEGASPGVLETWLAFGKLYEDPSLANQLVQFH